MLSFVVSTVSVLNCPGIQELIMLSGIALALLVGLLNSRQLRRISNTTVLKDHLRKRK